MKVALAADEGCQEHQTGFGHPEQAARFRAVREALAQAGLTAQMQLLPSRAATLEELALVHTPAYLALAQREIAAGADSLSTGDTPICPASWAAATQAAGSVLAATDAVCAGAAARAFCLARPPGHHAGAGYGMGFCIFNQVALAARQAQRRHALERVLIVDWDVHHGNGTQDIFYDDPSVFFCSTHQSPLYPGTGAAQETGRGAGAGTTLNLPLPAGSGRAEILGALQRALPPAMESFRPELVLISAGFDARRDDPLGGFTLEDEDFADLTAFLRELADRHAGGRLLSVLEGGYALSGLASAATAHVRALLA